MSTLRLPEILKAYSAPSSSSDSQMSEQYDYSGLDDHIKRQDTIGSLRDQKFAKLASGDVLGAQATGNQIRDLLAAVKANAPSATERNPNQIAAPLVRTTSRSVSSSSKSGGGGFEGMPEPQGQRRDVPAGGGAPGGGGGKQNGKPPAAPPPAGPRLPVPAHWGQPRITDPGSHDVPLPPKPTAMPPAATGLAGFMQRGGANSLALRPAAASPVEEPDGWQQGFAFGPRR